MMSSWSFNSNTHRESESSLLYQQAVEFIQSLPEGIQVPAEEEITMDFVEQYLTDYLMLKNPADNPLDQPRVTATKLQVGILLKQARINLMKSNRWNSSQKIMDTLSIPIRGEEKKNPDQHQEDILEVLWTEQEENLKKDISSSSFYTIIPSEDEKALLWYIAQIKTLRGVILPEDKKLLENFWSMIERYSTVEQYQKFRDAFFSSASGRSLHHIKVALQWHRTPLQIFLRSLKREVWE